MQGAGIALLIAFEMCSGIPEWSIPLPDLAVCQRALPLVEADARLLGREYYQPRWQCFLREEAAKRMEEMRGQAGNFACQ